MKHSSKADLLEPLVISAALIGYSNGIALWSIRKGSVPETLFHYLNPVLIVLMLAYAAVRPGGLKGVGLHGQNLATSTLSGTTLGLALSLPPLFFFKRPFLLDTPLEYGPITRLSRRELLVDVLVRVPIGIAVLEELGFRGLLHTALRRHFPPAVAIAGSAAAFAGWHLTVTATSAAQTNIGTAHRLPPFLKPYVQVISVVGGMLTTGLAGVAFGLLRERTGNLAGPILAHWVVDALLIVALWLHRPGLGPNTMR